MAQNTRDSVPNIFPELVYDDAPAALDWLERVFGFVRGEVIEGPDGTIAHAEMHLGTGTIMVEPFDTDYGARNYTTRDLEGHLWSFGTYVPRGGSARADV